MNVLRNLARDTVGEQKDAVYLVLHASKTRVGKAIEDTVTLQGLHAVNELLDFLVLGLHSVYQPEMKK